MRDQSRGNELLLALERHLRVGKVGGPLRHGGTRKPSATSCTTTVPKSESAALGSSARCERQRYQPTAPNTRAAAAASPRTRALMPRAPCRARAFPGSSCRLRPPLVLHLGARP